MHLTNLTTDRLPALYAFWQEIGGAVPFFYQVDFETWRACLIDFHQGYEGLLLTPDTAQFLLAVEEQQIVGLIQFGQPSFSWDDHGQRVTNPNIGIIRYFHYSPDHPAAGEALLQEAMNQLSQVSELHAFFQAHGLSCHAWHGKLHPSYQHVEGLLLEHGFSVDQENLFYSHDLCSLAELGPERVTVSLTADEETSQHFAAWSDGIKVGTAILHPLDKLTGGATTDTVYMRWIGVNRELRGQGLGTQFLAQLARHYLTHGYCTLHLDTASTNFGAQRFYERHGFSYLGSTRSYARR